MCGVRKSDDWFPMDTVILAGVIHVRWTNENNGGFFILVITRHIWADSGICRCSPIGSECTRACAFVYISDIKMAHVSPFGVRIKDGFALFLSFHR